MEQSPHKTSFYFFPYIGLALGGMLLYLPTLFYELTYLDDNVWILDYQWFLKDARNLGTVFLQPDLLSPLFYRPLLSISFILNAQVGGTIPFVYHLSNMVIHLFNVFLLCTILERLGYPRRWALSMGYIFCAHPVLTQAVAWIPGRTDSLLAFFVLLSFLSLLDYLKEGKGVYLITHLSFLICALLTKETAIAVPLVYFLYVSMDPWRISFSQMDHFIRKKEGSQPKITKKREFPRRTLLCVWLGVIAGWFFLHHVLTDATNVGVSLALSSLWNNLPAVMAYLGKIFWPVNLSVTPFLKDMSLVYGMVVLGALIILTSISKNIRWPPIIFGWCWFLLFLLPSLILSFIKQEYRLYLPMIGMIFVISELNVMRWLMKDTKRSIIFTIVVAGGLAFITVHYSQQFKNRWTFWQNAVISSPHLPLAQRNLGAMYFLKGEYDRAEGLFEMALALNPYEKMVYNNLGLIYGIRGEYGRAEEAFKTEIKLYPDYDNAYYNLGLLYYQTGHLDKAERTWRRAIELNPKNIEAYRNLLIVAMRRNDKQTASHFARELQKRGIPISLEIQRWLNSL